MREKITLYKGKVTIWFIDNEGRIKHSYYHDKNGEADLSRRIISNTGATGMIDKSTPMKFWAVNKSIDFLLEKLKTEEAISEPLLEEARKQHTVFTEEAKTSGVEVHDWIKGFIEYKLKIEKKIPKMPTDPKVLNGVNGFLRWESDNKVKFIRCEQIAYSIKYDVGGRFDFDAIINGKFTMADLKTCNMWKKDKRSPDGFKRDRKGNLVKTPVYDEQKYQVAGYRMEMEEEYGKVYEGDRIILRLDKDFGEFDPVQLDDYKTDKKGFLACVCLKRIKKN